MSEIPSSNGRCPKCGEAYSPSPVHACFGAPKSNMRVGQLIDYWTAKAQSHERWPEGQGQAAEALARIYVDTIATLRAALQVETSDPHEVYATCLSCGDKSVKRGFARTCCAEGAEIDRDLGLLPPSDGESHMTLNRLHKILGKLIEQGYGRRLVSVEKNSFRDNRENDGCTILPVSCVDVQWIHDADDDGGLATNKDGTERGQTTVILGGYSYEAKK